MIKLDTHGVEIPILEGAKRTLENTNVLVIEAYNFTFGDVAVPFWELCRYLLRLGFRPLDMFDILYREVDDASYGSLICSLREPTCHFFATRGTSSMIAIDARVLCVSPYAKLSAERRSRLAEAVRPSEDRAMSPRDRGAGTESVKLKNNFSIVPRGNHSISVDYTRFCTPRPYAESLSSCQAYS
jgi:hypothetical protein